jgi:hypothetical protein
VMISFVALAFVRMQGGLVPSEEVECPLPGVAIRRAQAMSSNEANAGAIAATRSRDGCRWISSRSMSPKGCGTKPASTVPPPTETSPGRRPARQQPRSQRAAALVGPADQ